MPLLSLPDLPSAPEFEARPSARLRYGAAATWVIVAGGMLLVMRSGSGAAFVISLGVILLTTILLTEILSMRVLVGDEWIASHRPSGWNVLRLGDGVVASSASSRITGDWLFLRGAGGIVAVSSVLEGAGDVMEAIYPHLRKIRMDPVTRERLEI